MDIKIFVDTDVDERLIRRIRRDILERGRTVENVINQYLDIVKPMHLEFVEPSKHWTDIIIPRGADNLIAIDMVVTKIRSMLITKK
jgi:uridine kinase